MPLAFESISHGRIAFGFFNIYSDMLLLERYFLFASDFCKEIIGVAEATTIGEFTCPWDVYHIKNLEEIGDLGGAIYGVHFSGFIGETYKMYPFPKAPEEFKQRPDGDKNRGVFKEIISPFSPIQSITFSGSPADDQVHIGVYSFTRKSFQALVNYVWIGGYPRWKDEVRPDYVQNMRDAVNRSENWTFENLFLD